MSILELKGDICQRIFLQVHEEALLLKILEFVEETLDEPDFGLTAEQERDLEESVRESEIETNLVSNEDAKKLRAQWLQ